MGSSQSRETAMVRYECGQCDMTATMVDNDRSESAWRDHMMSHVEELDWRTWRWTVRTLPFDQTDTV